MQNIISVNKPLGMTPLEVILSLKHKRPDLVDKKITYAGRLDPLAHGVLLLLIEDEIKNKMRYLSLKKTYEFEIVFGLATDTYDVLGYLQDAKIKKSDINVNLFVNKFVNRYIGKQIQTYPPYSSKTVNGKPLFWWAKNNKLNEIEIPKHETEIYKFSVLSIGSIVIKKLEKKIKEEISQVKGDFRQKIILERWNELFDKENPETKLHTAKFRIICSSGTYIREIANQMGIELGCGGVAIDILRTSIGDYSLNEALVY
jgi:tRNA pseudouridine55 synthase